ncbi:hypothetical protein Acor_77650 [Acrocarpospora corrugata]|uniref:Uncharacterized protein n=1 Tax=Acrocarpospora corrugata TaxID=35763 RepID=A0A5M3W9F5_9ACTN|nr:hypothetical protein Acor_77650 [Acrocarpospora corrugata]
MFWPSGGRTAARAAGAVTAIEATATASATAKAIRKRPVLSDLFTVEPLKSVLRALCAQMVRQRAYGGHRSVL